MTGVGAGIALALGLCACSNGQTPTANAPKVGVARLEDLPTPLPRPYVEGAPAMADVDAAFAQAKAEDKRVIVDLGGDWCPWCRMLAGVMELPSVRPFVDANFVVVSVDVSSAKGITDRNLAVVRRFGMDKVAGFPWLVVAEPDGKVLASSYAVTDERHHTPQTMVNWLAQFAKNSGAKRSATRVAVEGVGRA